MRFPRSSGVLLHPTSLPGPYGIGDAGREAFRFVDWLASAGQSVWQVLPLGPTGFGDSPYQCFSAVAGNPLLISPDALVEEGLLTREDFADAPQFPAGGVDFGPVITWKFALLRRAAGRFERGEGRAAELRGAFEEWRGRNASWLEDFTLFMAIKDAHGGAPWVEWPEPLRRRDGAALAAARGTHAGNVALHAFLHWTFFRQWAALRAHAASRGIAIMGDAPIFVAHDSADVWANPGLFQLGEDGRPTAVAGVPPDYFSDLGQLWGNPLYRWDALAADGYAWWVARVRALFTLVDRVRLDHFIGFTRCWAVPAGAPDARTGRFEPGPGAELFRALERELGRLPIVAEDLGVLTPEVETLRDTFAFPGMKVLQFAFAGGADNPFLPHHHLPNGVVYTGTHDNDTLVGWWASASEAERHQARRYLASPLRDPAWDLLRVAMASVSDTCIVPAQDLLDLGNEARMNFPGRPSGNWSWRLEPGALDDALAARLNLLTSIYGRERR
jgi:4-alpha-glucanotransferase